MSEIKGNNKQVRQAGGHIFECRGDNNIINSRNITIINLDSQLLKLLLESINTNNTLLNKLIESVTNK